MSLPIYPNRDALITALTRLEEARRQMAGVVQSIREVQIRLGTDEERAEDIELARNLGHRYMNLLQGFSVARELREERQRLGEKLPEAI